MTVNNQQRTKLGLIIGISSLFAAYFFAFGLFLPYFPVYLKDLAFTPVQIALIVAIPNIVRIVATPVMTGISDRAGRRRLSISIFAIVCAVAFGVIANVNTYALMVAVVVVMSIFLAPLQPLSDAYAYEAVKSRGLDYGVMRSWGSAAFIAATMFGGWYLGLFESVQLVYFMVVGLVVMAVLSLQLPGMPSEHRKAAQGAADEGHAKGELQRLELHIVLFAGGLTLGSMAGLFSFGSIFWLSHGISDTNVGLLWSAGVLAEISVFLLGGRLLGRIGPLGFMLIGAIGGILRWIVFPHADTFGSALVVQLMHGVNFGMTHLGMMAFLAEVVSGKRLGTAQGLSQTYIGLFTGVAGITAGWIYEVNPTYAFYAMAVVAAGGSIVLGLFWARLRRFSGEVPAG
ncbi:MFS transporter [Pseudovibrio exalbescens]|uniref:MFS transporter n=1 Tax=Pseudovibrio exalbescens TaxID=197461 RepID=UPI00236710D1|nr:MFS transporter [Pseudovibrio exalbescens]MDD7910403.1 MFS transporter [Pseudovibrio exalbescens]